MFDELSGMDLSKIPSRTQNDSSDYSEEENEETNVAIYPNPSNKSYYKIIETLGQGTEKPGKLDKLEVQIQESQETKTIDLPYENPEFSALLQTMKANETSVLYFNETSVKVKLISWVSIKDLLDDGNMIKTITKKGMGYDLIENKDDVKLKIRILAFSKEIYNEEKIVSCELPLISPGLYEILKTMKLLESAQITIKSPYYKSNFPDFPFAEEDVSIEIDVLDLRKVEDMYLDGSFYKKVVIEGEGKNLPNTNASVRIRYKLEIDNKVVLSNFEDSLLQIIMDEDEVPSL